MTELRIDQDRLVDWASRAIGIPSFTGSEEAMAELMRETFLDLGLQVQWQQVEDGRANVLGTRGGVGGGPSLMFNGHMDTSYSGREPWLAHVPGFQPSAFVEDGRLYGLGISNMKGALACYVEALRALTDAGVRLRGDVMIAAVSGEIEKTQYGDAQGAEFRGYAAGSRYLVSHGGVADMCILGEPTESKVVLGHFGSLWLRISTKGPFIHTAFSEGKRDQNSIVRMRDVLEAVLEWIPSWEDDPSNAYRGAKAIVNVGAVEGGFGWRVSRTPHRTDLFLDVRVPPTKEMATARSQVLEMVRGLAERFPEHGIEGEVYVTAPGAEIAEDHALVGAIDAAHAEVFGARAGAGRHALVLRRLGPHPLRDRDGELRDVDRPSRHGEGREPRDRRAREDRGGLRSGSDERLWSRMSLYQLPADLPVPVDDGAADHLVGLEVPNLELDSSEGRVDLAELAARLAVLYVYPATGVPGRPSPDGWDAIPGARGCTPQACAFRDHADELAELGARVAGLSAQSLEQQIEFARREHMPFPVVADPELRLRDALALPTFEFAGRTLYKRTTIVFEAGRIHHVFYPVFPPDRNVEDVIAWLQSRASA